MALLTRTQIAAPALRKEAVEVPALGGAVIVRGLLLSERMELSALAADLREPQPGESAALVAQRVGRQMVMFTLARTVVLDDDAPVYTAAEWDRFGADHPDAVLNLYRKAREISGYNDAPAAAGADDAAPPEGAAEKN